MFTSYILEIDFATAGRPSFYDVWAEQEQVPIFNSVRVGQFLQPFSVDAMSGFRHLPFLERSLPFNCFVPFRRVGAMSSVNTEDKMTYWASSVFRTGGFNNNPIGDSRFATDIGNQGGYSFSTRATHFSTSGSSSVPFYQARTGPEFGPLGAGIDTASPQFGPVAYAASNITPPVFVDTGRYRASGFNLFGLETVAQYGALSLQAEFMATQVFSPVGPIWYTGGYGEVMYRLTGEHRRYDRRLGAFYNPIPFTDFISLRKPGRVIGWGCWEVSARLSYVDLRNPQSLNPFYLAGTNNSGNGTLTDSTLGVTWMLNAHSKVQVNWIHAMLNNASTVAGTARG